MCCRSLKGARWACVEKKSRISFTLIELLMVVFILVILIAIAIPLIVGVREAANNSKCRSNLEQLHTALFAYATMNKEFLPNIAADNDLLFLEEGGYIDVDSKLGDCPGSDPEEGITATAYIGGDSLKGQRRLSAIKSDEIILSDEYVDNHHAGGNAIRMDGSFTRSAREKLGMRGKLKSPQDAPDLGTEDGDIPDLDGDLIDAVLDNDLPRVRVLLHQGADVNVRTGYDNTPLHLATQWEDGEIVELLLKQNEVKLNETNYDGATPMHMSISFGFIKPARILANKKGVNMNVQNDKGNSPLHFACIRGRTQIATLLIENDRVNLNLQNRKGNTPLHLACLYNLTTTIVPLLINQETVNLNLQNRKGNTPLHLACLYNLIEPATVLIDKEKEGVDLNSQNKDGNTPLHLACLYGRTRLAALLVDHNQVNLNFRNRKGNTPLHLALYKRYTLIAKNIVNRKDRVNVNVKNNDGKTPLDILMAQGEDAEGLMEIYKKTKE